MIFDWKYDSFPEITRDRMKLYKLHVRGFSMDVSGDKKHKGTFEAVSDRINYIKKIRLYFNSSHACIRV